MSDYTKIEEGDKARLVNLEQAKLQTKAQEQANDFLERAATALETMANEKMLSNGELLNHYVLSALSENTDVEKYEQVKKFYFWARGAASLNGTATSQEAAALTGIVGDWFKLTRQLVKNFDGWVDFYNPTTSSLSTGIRRGDLENMECVPSTDKEAGKDDFAGHPLFAVTTCNWVMNGTEPVITAIKGISPDFEQSNPNKYVGVLQMSGYHWWTERSESDQYEKEGYRATYSAAYSHIEPLPESVKMDGTVREWVLHGKYMAGAKADGSLTCCSGQMPKLNMSHNSLQTATKLDGEGYSGGTSADRSFIILMAKLLFASKTLDGILNGCFSYDAYNPAQVSETNVKRVIVSKGRGASYLVGSSVIISHFTDKYDYLERGTALQNGAKQCKVTAVEEVTINDVTYDAVYVDLEEPFNTSALGEKVAGTTYITTMPWESGTNDTLKGNTGALNVTDTKHIISIQGIELMNGSYEVLADTIMKLWKDDTAYYYTPYIVKEASKQSTNITSDYINTGINATQPDADSWQYIKHQSYKNGFYFADETGGSSSTYEKDGVWMSAKTENTVREFLAFGSLGGGIWDGGLSCVHGGSGVGTSGWNIGARLSPNGNRGNW